MTNPFAPKVTAPNSGNNTDADDTPFDDDGFDIPPAPVGVLRGHITEVRPAKDKSTGKIKGWMINIHCDDPSYAASEDIGVWIKYDERAKFRNIAAHLGLQCETRGTNTIFTDSDGNRNLAAFKHKPVLCIYAPYKSEPSIARFGVPRPGDSPEWDQYISERAEAHYGVAFTDEQKAALKRAGNAMGILPADTYDLFD